MTPQQHAVLSFFYEENVEHLTPGFLAYRMQLSPQDATSLLDELVLDSALDLELDEEGNLLYVLPEADRQRMQQQQKRRSQAPNSPSAGTSGSHSAPNSSAGYPDDIAGADGSIYTNYRSPSDDFGQPSPDPYQGYHGGPPVAHHPPGQMQIYEPRGNSFLAALLSIFIPGAGQFYNREFVKGLAMFFGTAFMWVIAMGWVIQLWSIIDAYAVAKKPRLLNCNRPNN